MLAAPPNDAIPTLGETLRAATWPQHRSVERSDFVQALLRGELDRDSYCLLLRSLHTIYASLESHLSDHASHAAFAGLDIAGLARRASLERDLAVLHGPRWHDDLKPQAAAVRYARHLGTLAATRPELLLAHAYVRYLGDLSGGQALRRIVARSLGLRGDEGTRFYDFGDAPAVARRFRAALAAVADATARHADVAAEARAAFDLHAQLFDELGATV